MSTLTAKTRDMSRSGKQLRKKGIIPAIIYGKSLEEPVAIELSEKEAHSFLRSNSIGSQVNLTVDSKPYSAMLKDLSRVVLSNKVEHLDFQALTAGEKVKANVHIQLLNKEAIEAGGVINELMDEIEVESLPKDLPTHIDVDLSGLKIGDSFLVKDLILVGDDRFHLHTPLDSAIVHISAPKGDSEDEEGAEDEMPTAPNAEA